MPGDAIGFKQEREKRAEWVHSASFSISCLKPIVSPGIVSLGYLASYQNGAEGPRVPRVPNSRDGRTNYFGATATDCAA